MKFQPKGKTKVRLLSLILAVAMLFSAVPWQPLPMLPMFRLQFLQTLII